MLRAINQADTDTVVQLSCGSGLFAAEEADSLHGMLEEYFSTNSGGGEIQLWETEGRAQGVIYFTPRPFADRVWEILMIAVDTPYQRTGIGSKMLVAVEDIVRKADGRLMLIETSSKSSFERTRSFYRKHGYNEVAHIPDYFSDGDGKASFLKRLASCE